jgi:predicted nuclease of predicted toxin-antitoxin system
MKFLADENISAKVVNALRSKDIEVVSIKEVASNLDDETVLEPANIQNRILITFDADFGELVFKKKSKTKGIILLKFTPKSSQHVSETIAHVLATPAKIEGHFLIVKEKRIRVSPLKAISN